VREKINKINKMNKPLPECLISWKKNYQVQAAAGHVTFAEQDSVL
jgi:hypothetical protein